MSTNEDELENLFDSIVTDQNKKQATENSVKQTHCSTGQENQAVINQIGKMTRELHDTLRELGVSKEIERAASSIPDARDRLNYVATLTQQAAEKVLNATEAAEPLVTKMEIDGNQLAAQWDLMMAGRLTKDEFKALAASTHLFVHAVPLQARATKAILTDIMMAQDFQDLTGQVIKKIIDVTKQMEQQPLSLLLESAPPEVKAEFDAGLLNGPVINPEGRTDIVASQDQVDDLLASMGF